MSIIFMALMIYFTRSDCHDDYQCNGSYCENDCSSGSNSYDKFSCITCGSNPSHTSGCDHDEKKYACTTGDCSNSLSTINKCFFCDPS